MATSHPVTEQEALISTLEKSTLCLATGAGTTGAALIILSVAGRPDLAPVGLYVLGIGIIAAVGAAIMRCIAATSTHTQKMVVENRSLLTTYDEQIETAIEGVQRTGRNILLAADVIDDDDELAKRRRHSRHN